MYLYGSTGYDLRRFIVTPDGIMEDAYFNGSLIWGATDIHYDKGFIFAVGGDVVDEAGMKRVGSTHGRGDARPDVANGRVFYVEDRELVAYHFNTLTHLGTLEIPELEGSRYPVRWGRDGIATGGGEFVLFIRSPLIGS